VLVSTIFVVQMNGTDLRGEKQGKLWEKAAVGCFEFPQ